VTGFVFNLILSWILIAVSTLVALGLKQRPGRAGVAIGAAGVALGMMFLQTPNFILNSFLLVVAGLICLAFGLSKQTFLISSLGATAVAYLCSMAWGAYQLREYDRLRAIHPLESMTKRLGYEQRKPDPREKLSVKPAPQSEERDRLIGQKLQAMESCGHGDPMQMYRRETLQQLHEQMVTVFAASPGFGVGRMPFLPESILKEDRWVRQPVPMAAPKDSEPGTKKVSASTIAGEPKANLDAASLDTLQDMYVNSVGDFVFPAGFGYLRDREHVAGFLPHQFRDMPKVSDAREHQHRWTVQRVELVSLLKFDEPAVYVSEHLPRMQELRDAATRPLDKFEKTALASLAQGDDLKTDVHGGHLRMLGAVRALSQCVKCHDAKRGELLGAFSYRLRQQ
jgi:hypothetical protein